MSSEQLQKIMRRARELSDRISSAESRSGSDFDSASASGSVQEQPKSQPPAGPAYEVRPQFVQQQFFEAPAQLLPPRLPGRLPGP